MAKELKLFQKMEEILQIIFLELKSDFQERRALLMSYYWVIIDLLIFSFLIITKNEWTSRSPEFFDVFPESLVCGFLFWMLWNSSYRDSILIFKEHDVAKTSNSLLPRVFARFIASTIRNSFIILICIPVVVGLSFTGIIEKFHFSFFYITYIPIFLVSAAAFMFGLTLFMSIVTNKYRYGYVLSLVVLYFLLISSSYYFPIFSFFNYQDAPFGLPALPTTIGESFDQFYDLNLDILAFCLLLPSSISLYLIRVFFLYGMNRRMNYGGYGYGGFEYGRNEALLLSPVMAYFSIIILISGILTFRWYEKEEKNKPKPTEKFNEVLDQVNQPIQ